MFNKLSYTTFCLWQVSSLAYLASLTAQGPFREVTIYFCSYSIESHVGRRSYRPTLKRDFVERIPIHAAQRLITLMLSVGGLSGFPSGAFPVATGCF